MDTAIPIPVPEHASKRGHAPFAADAVASTGWHARLALEYTFDSGRTRLERNHHHGPLMVQKSLYPEGADICHTLILHPPGGIVAGDRLDIDVTLNAGSRVLLTTPGATRWYRSTGAGAMQCVRVGVAEGAVVEWLPPETIVYNHAVARQQTTVTLAAGARYIGWDIVCLGRTASGEHFEQGAWRQSTQLSLAGEPLWNEQCAIDGGSPLLGSQVGLAGMPVSATLLAAGVSIPPELMSACRALAVEAPARAGISVMPDLLVARCVARSAEPARQYLIAVWRLLRPVVSGRCALLPRIWST